MKPRKKNQSKAEKDILINGLLKELILSYKLNENYSKQMGQPKKSAVYSIRLIELEETIRAFNGHK